jgi:choline dehydrogenase-like flavoprotein
VLCLEQGEWPDQDKFVGRREEWELLSETRWSPNPNDRLLEADYPLDVSECDLRPMLFNGVGGSTTLWNALWHRLTPSDFCVRSLDGVGNDWAVTYEELAPFYDRVEQDMGVSGHAGDPAYPAHADYPLPPFPLGKSGDRFAAAMNRKGWHWWPGSNGIPSRAYRGRNACVRRGTCAIGCADGAKASTFLTHWPDAIAHGARLLTGMRVKEITTDAAGLATGAVYVDRSGEEHRVRADVVILCANGVGTSRLMMLSQSARFPNGLANSSGLVGRGLMLHPCGTVMGLFDEDMDSTIGPFGQYLYSMQFYNTDLSRGFVRGSKWSLIPHGGPLSFAMAMGYGEAMQAGVLSAFNRAATLVVFCEDLPEDHNRVSLSDELTDSDGLPAPKLHYRVSQNSRKLLEFNTARAAEALHEAGAKDSFVTVVNPEAGGAHLLGTARMGSDPETSVVDRWGRSHDVPNLYIFDGSIFPSSGAVNPTATICALAQRGAEHLVRERRSQRVPA